MTSSDEIQWLAFAIGTVGTWLWAINYKHNGRPLEAYFWLASSALWIGFSLLHYYAGLALRDVLGPSLYFLAIYKLQRSPAPSVELEVQGPHAACEKCKGFGYHPDPGTRASLLCECWDYAVFLKKHWPKPSSNNSLSSDREA